jgi:hypothetical protein
MRTRGATTIEPGRGIALAREREIGGLEYKQVENMTKPVIRVNG